MTVQSTSALRDLPRCMGFEQLHVFIEMRCCSVQCWQAVAAAAHESAAIDKVIKKEDAALNKGAK